MSNLYGQILDTAPCGFLSFTDDGVIAEVNATLINMLGYENKQLVIGQHIHMLFTTAGRIFYSTHFFPLLKLHGEAKEIFFNLRKQDNLPLPVVCNAAKRTGTDTDIYDCVFTSASERIKFEEEILRAKKTAELALSENTELVSVKKQLKQKNLEADRYIRHLLHFNKELADISKIVTHDLQEPVRKIAIWADKMVLDNSEILPPNVAVYLRKVYVECVKMRGITGRLEDYMHISLEPTYERSIDLNAIVGQALKRAIADNGGRKVNFIIDALPHIEGNSAQLLLLFTNLFDNSIKYGPAGEPIEIDIQYTEIEQNSVVNVKGTYSYTKHAQLIISDNGLNTDYINKQNPFQIYKKDFSSTLQMGFGLAFCKKIVEVHRGTIELTTSDAQGVAIKIALPFEQALLPNV